MALKSKKKPKRPPRRPRLFLAGLGVGVLTLVLGVYFAVLRSQIRPLALKSPKTTAFLEKQTPGGTLKRWTPLSAFSPYLVCAVLKAEDRAFFRHGAFDWSQVQKTVSSNLESGRLWGASTLTQQLARNLFLGPERSVFRKGREAFWAIALEAELDKKRILEIYLNVVEWGDGVWGATEAASLYLGQSPSQVDAGGAIFLASLLAAPKSPLTGANRARAMGVQNRLLGQLQKAGVIDASQAGSANVFLEERMNREGTLNLGLKDIPPVEAYLRSECGLDRELSAGGPQ